MAELSLDGKGRFMVAIDSVIWFFVQYCYCSKFGKQFVNMDNGIE